MTHNVLNHNRAPGVPRQVAEGTLGAAKGRYLQLRDRQPALALQPTRWRVTGRGGGKGRGGELGGPATRYGDTAEAGVTTWAAFLLS
jgi:hypothetical protein